MSNEDNTSGAVPTEIIIPTLADILGTEPAPSEVAPEGGARTGRAASSTAPFDPTVNIRALEAQVKALQTQLQSAPQKPAASLDPTEFANALRDAMRPPQEPVVFDPMKYVSPELAKEFPEFTNSALAPALRAMHDDLTQSSTAQNKQLLAQLAHLTDKLAAVEKASDPTSIKKAAVHTSLRSIHPDWDSIHTSTEWEEHMRAVNPLLGLPNSEVLEWRQKNHSVDEVLQSYSALINDFRAKHDSYQQPASGATTRSMARPRPGAAVAPAAAVSIEAELRKTEEAIEAIKAKEQRTQKDVDTINKLYDRMRSLVASATPAQGR